MAYYTRYHWRPAGRGKCQQLGCRNRAKWCLEWQTATMSAPAPEYRCGKHAGADSIEPCGTVPEGSVINPEIKP